MKTISYGAIATLCFTVSAWIAIGFAPALVILGACLVVMQIHKDIDRS